MSSPLPRPERKPLIALVDRANRALQRHMVEAAHRRGHPEVKPSHNAVFATLLQEGTRATDMATRAGMTRQSMGEVIRDLVRLGILEMVPDPDDGRAKVVRYTEEGTRLADEGFRHLRSLEDRFTEEFGADYEAARAVLERVVTMLEELDGDQG